MAVRRLFLNAGDDRCQGSTTVSFALMTMVDDEERNPPLRGGIRKITKDSKTDHCFMMKKRVRGVGGVKLNFGYRIENGGC